jgi:hypothetical protein
MWKAPDLFKGHKETMFIISQILVVSIGFSSQISRQIVKIHMKGNFSHPERYLPESFGAFGKMDAKPA